MSVKMATIDSSNDQELARAEIVVEDADGWILVGPGVWSPGPRAVAAFIEYRKQNSERLTDELRRLKLDIEALQRSRSIENDQGT